MPRQRPTRLVMRPCIVEIDRIVIREVRHQLEVNRCGNEEIIVKGNFGWAWPMWAAGAPVLVMGPCIVEIDRIVIREVQYHFEVNRCRNEKIIVKGNFGWARHMWAGRPRIDRIVIRECQGSSANSVGDNSGQDGRTDRRTDGQTYGGDNHYPHAFQKAWG
ncbi:hypothetical protein DPMN_053844 [Dreissena polymorpha]|uniref:Uncharacterized protein n=1 Tax=Dreissena polymorpha TaxID=45954 RepID=A0A9D4CP67_DREPO|nr:hypothetical protein DPMN_053844 [Dreissena polymorpha]